MSILQIYLILLYKEKDKFSNQDTQYCLDFFNHEISHLLMRNVYLKEEGCIIITYFSFHVVIYAQTNDLTEHKWMQAYCRLVLQTSKKGDS